MSKLVEDDLLGADDEFDYGSYDISNEKEDDLLQDEDEDEYPQSDEHDGDKKESAEEQDDILNLDVEEDFQDDEAVCDEDESENENRRNKKFVSERGPILKVLSAPESANIDQPSVSQSGPANTEMVISKKYMPRRDNRWRGNMRGNFLPKYNSQPRPNYQPRPNNFQPRPNNFQPRHCFQPRPYFSRNAEKRRSTVLINPRYEGIVHINENNARLAFPCSTQQSQPQANNQNFVQPWANGNVPGSNYQLSSPSSILNLFSGLVQSTQPFLPQPPVQPTQSHLSPQIQAQPPFFQQQMTFESPVNQFPQQQQQFPCQNQQQYPQWNNNNCYKGIQQNKVFQPPPRLNLQNQQNFNCHQNYNQSNQQNQIHKPNFKRNDYVHNNFQNKFENRSFTQNRTLNNDKNSSTIRYENRNLNQVTIQRDNIQTNRCFVNTNIANQTDNKNFGTAMTRPPPKFEAETFGELPEKKIKVADNLVKGMEMKSSEKVEDEEEDDEMKQYRLKIEEQKKEREKLLQIKEERRKQMMMQRQKRDEEQLIVGPPKLLQSTPVQNAPAVKITPSFVAKPQPSSASTDFGADEFSNLTFKVSNNAQQFKPTDASHFTAGSSSSGFMANRVVLVKSTNNNQPSGVVKRLPTKESVAPPQEEVSSFLTNRTVLKKDNDLPNTRLVIVNNLAASTTQNTLVALTRGIGEIQKLQLDKQERQATILFKSVASAHAFFKKYQRRILDLSVIEVKLEPLL